MHPGRQAGTHIVAPPPRAHHPFPQSPRVYNARLTYKVEVCVGSNARIMHHPSNPGEPAQSATPVIDLVSMQPPVQCITHIA